MNDEPQNLFSVPGACRLLGCMPTRLQAELEARGIRPAMTIDGRPHFRESDLERVRHAVTRPPGRGFKPKLQ